MVKWKGYWSQYSTVPTVTVIGPEEKHVPVPYRYRLLVPVRWLINDRQRSQKFKIQMSKVKIFLLFVDSLRQYELKILSYNIAPVGTGTKNANIINFDFLLANTVPGYLCVSRE